MLPLLPPRGLDTVSFLPLSLLVLFVPPRSCSDDDQITNRT